MDYSSFEKYKLNKDPESYVPVETTDLFQINLNRNWDLEVLEDDFVTVNNIVWDDNFEQLFKNIVYRPLNLFCKSTHYRNTQSSDSFTKNFLIDRIFTSVISSRKLNSQIRFTGQMGTIATYNSNFELKREYGINLLNFNPLAILMVKLKYVPYLRACFLLGKSVDKSIFQLWVDKSLDSTDSIYPIRPAFVRNIKKPLKSLGVEYKVFNSLKSVLLNPIYKKTFSTYTERKNYFQNNMEKALKELWEKKENIEGNPF